MLPPSTPEFAYQPLCFNQHQFRQKLEKEPAINVFKDAIAGVTTHLGMLFREGENIRSLVTARAGFIDLILHYAWHQFTWDDTICLIAVGGYGRGELHPHSDIDLLFLLDNVVTDQHDDNIRNLITFLWDIGLEIGSSVRTVNECLKIAKEDVTVVTNLLESRRLEGNNQLKTTLRAKIGPDSMWPMKTFFASKWEEQQSRYERHNYTECNLEPNIKNAPGGLRDLQMINWLAKRYFGVQTLIQLAGSDFFTEHEYSVILTTEEFLWRVRFGVHLLSGRAEERLLFEYQRELATLFGYEDSKKELAVEQFMHEYYRCVMELRTLNDVLLQYLEERTRKGHEKESVITINERFRLRNDYIEVSSSKVFDNTPSALLEIFILAGSQENIAGIRASTIRLIREKCSLINKDFREDATNRALFLKIFSIKYGLLTQLTRMKRYGVLGRYLPAFGDIVGQMQHDLFHRYTVDEHTLLVLRNIRGLLQQGAEQTYPVAAAIAKKINKPELLYIAALFHDIAKGRGGDHSELGAIDAERFCKEHGLSSSETRLIAWLVEKHLLMSFVSQKKDISEPEVIRDFALSVGDRRYLDFLFVLTHADMRATNPDIWNSWRASLMRQLYNETKRVLRLGLENTIDLQETINETQLKAFALLKAKKVNLEEAKLLWQDMGDEYFIRESYADIARHTEALIKHDHNKPLILINETTDSEFEGATQIFIWAKDSLHIFCAATTCLAQLNLNIQDAKIYQSKTGYTLDTFYVLDENFEALGQDQEKYNRIHDALQEELALVGEYTDLANRRTPRVLKQFGIPTQTSIRNDIVSGYTVLEVISPDRPGFLATIAQIFMEDNIVVHNARISTLGERVEDVFFITDIDGNPLSDADACEALQAKICRRLDRKVNKELNH